MKCPECGSAKWLSLGRTETLIGAAPEVFIDGVRHWHDFNHFSVVFECSHGHRVEIAYKEACCVQDCKFNRGVA